MTSTRVPTRQIGIRQRSLRKHCRLGRATELVFILATGMVLTLGGQAQAQVTADWTGATNSDFTTPGNYTGTVDPTNNDFLLDDAGVTQPILTAPDFDVNSVTVSAGMLTVNGTLNVATDTEITGGTLRIAGTVVSAVSVVAPGTLDLNRGTITGNVTNTGTAFLSGNVDGTYTQNAGSTSIDDGGTIGPATTEVTGAVTINNGFLAVETDQTLEATAGITIGDGTGGAATATATINGSTVGDITVLSDGSVFANSGVAIDDDALVTLTGGELELNEDETIGGLAGNASATVDLDDKTLTVAGTGTTVFEGVISGTGGGLTKDGTGTLTLSGENTYTGATNVNAGTLTVSHAAALGTDAAGTTVADGATLALSGGISTAEALTLNGTGVSDGGALRNVSGDNTISGAITLGSATRINSDAGQLFLNGITGTNTNLTLGGAGILSTGNINLGTGTLTKDGSGGVAIAGTGTFASVTVTGGVLQINNGAAIPDAALVTLDDGTELVVANSETVGNLAGTGTVSISAMQTLTVNTGTAGTFGGVIQGDGGLTKLGVETLTLTGANTYAGTTTISAGTLQIGAGVGGGTTGTLGSGSVTNNAALVFNRSDDITVSNQITGTGTLTKQGTGTLTLSGSNGYTGATTVDEGTLAISHATALGTVDGATTVVDGATLALSGGISTAEALTLNGMGTGMPGVGALRNVSGDNTASGAITLGSATRINSDAGTLTLSGGVTGAFGLTVGGAGNTTIASVIGTGAGTLTKDGAGTLFLSSANTYTGGTDIDAGTLRVGAVGALGSGAVTVDSGAALEVAVNGIVLNALSIAGTGVGGNGAVARVAPETNISLNGAITLTGDATIGSAALGTVNINGIVTLDTNTLTLAGAGGFDQNGGSITGDGGLTTSAAGGVVLRSTNTYLGTTTVTAGNLVVVGGSAINDSGAVVVNGGTFLVSNSETVGSVAGAGNISISGGQVLTTGGNDTSTTVSGSVSGSGALVKAGSGTMTLSAANTYAGTTTISAGTLQIGDGGTTGTLGSGSVTNNAALVFNRSDDITVSNQITGTGTLTKQGAGRLTLSGSNGYTGLTTISAGTLEVTGNIAGNVVVGDGTLRIASGGTIGGTITTTGSVVSYANGVDEASALIISSATTQLEVLGTDAARQAGIISSTGVFGFEKIGSGTLTVSGNNTYTGATVVSAGTLELQSANGLGTTGVGAGTTVANGATLALSGPFTTAEALTLNGMGTGMPGVGALRNVLGNNTASGAITLGSATRINSDAGTLTLSGGVTGAFGLTVGGAGNTTISSVIGTGAGTLTKDGAGTLILSAANTYTGATTVDGGTLSITGSIDSTVVTVNDGGTLSVGGGDALLNTAAVTLNGTGDLTLTNANETIGSLDSSSATATVTLGANTLTTGDAGDDTFAGVISGTDGGLTKAGAGIFTLSGANDYTGTTTVSAGTLSITGSIDSTAVTVASAAILSVGGGDALVDTAAVTLNGTGNLTLTADETIGSLVSNGFVTLGDNTLTLASGTTTFSGVIGGDGGLTVAGANQTLTGNNTFTGETSVTSGALFVTGATGALASTAVSVSGGTLTTDADALAAGATVTVSGTGTFTSSETDSFTAITQTGGTVNGSGVLTLSGAFTQSGATTTTGGTVDINAGTFTQSDGATIAAGTTVTSSGAQALEGGTIAGALDGAGAITVSGSTSLTGTVTNAASLTATGGTLSVTGSGSINTTGNNITVNGGTITNDGDGFDDTEVVTVTTGTLTMDGNDTVASISQGGGVIGGAGTLTGATFTQTGGDMQGSVTTTDNDSDDITLQGGTISGTLTGGGTAITTGTTTLTGTLNSNYIVLSGAGSLTVEGPGAGLSADAQVNVNHSGSTLTLNKDDTVDDVVQNAGTIAGTGTLTTDTYLISAGEMAGILSASGTQSLQNGTISGTLSGTGAVNVEFGVGVTLTGSIASTDVTLQNGGSLTINATGTDPEDGLAAGTVLTLATGGPTEDAGTLTVTTDETITTLNMDAGQITGGGTLTVTGVATLTGGTISGNLSGGGGMGAGTVSVETGTVNLSAGGSIGNVAGLTIANNGTLRTSGGIGDSLVVNVITGGTLSVLANEEIGGLTGDGDVTIAADQTLTVSGSGGMFAGDIGGAGSISVETVTQTLSGTIGGTLTNTGTITVDAGDTLSAGVIENDAGRIDVGVGSTLAGTSNTINNGALITLAAGATLTDAGAITNEATGEIRVTGSGVTIESDDNDSGDEGITNAGLIDVQTGGTVTITSGSDTLQNDSTGTITLADGTSLTLGGTAAQTLENDGTVTIGAGATLDATTAGASFVNSNLATNNGTLGMALTVDGGTFTNAGAVTGATTVTGGILDLNTGTNLANAQALTVNGGAVNVNASDTVGSLSGTGGTITVAAMQTLTVTQSVAGGYAGVIAGDGGLTKDGGETLTLSGTNTFAGPLSVTAGTVTLDNGAAVGNATEVALSANTTLNLLASETVGILTGGDADVTLGANTLTVTDGTGSFAGDISGTGGLTVEAGADLTLSAANTFTGEALVTGGTLTVTGSLATTTVTVNGNGTLEVDGVALADAAEVTVDGDGTLVLLGSETIGSLDGSGTVNLDTFTLTTGDVGNDTFSGDFTGAGSLIKQGTGTFTLTGASDFAGTTSVNAGVLNIRNNTALGTAAAGTTVAANAALELQGGITVTGEALTLNGSGVSDGGALVNVSGDNTWTGNVTLASASEISSTAGTLTVSGTVDNGGFLLTVDGAGSTGLSGIISGAGGLTKQGTGVLTLSAANTYLGATAVNAGELVVATTGEIAAASAITVGTDGTLTNQGTIGGVTNDGIFDNESLATAGAVVNNATGTNDGTIASLDNNLLATFTTTGEVSGGITNDGTVNAQGDIFGVIQNNAVGVFNITGTAVADDTFTNSGDVNVNGGNLTGITALTNEDTGTLDIATTRQVSAASVANSDTGVITLVAGAGTSLTASTGGVSNTGDARIDVGADASVTATLGDITNDGEIDIGVGATVEATAGSVVNSGDGEITLLENATLTAGTDVTNADTGVITVGDGARVEATGNVENDASIVIQAGGTVEADVNIDNTANGTITLDDGASLLAGADLLNSNDIDILGTGITIGAGMDVGDLLTNDANGVIDFSDNATATFTGVAMANAGMINLGEDASMTVNGLFTGTGGTITRAVGTSGTTPLTFAGGYNGGGTIDLANGVTGEEITVGAASAFDGTVLQFDIDLTGGGGSSDVLTLTAGAITGTINLQFTVLGTPGQSNDITVIDFDGATGTPTYNVTGLPDASGTFVYNAVTVGDDLVVRSSLNPGAGAVVGGAVTIQSLIGSVVNRPTNAFVSGLGFDPGTGADAGTGGTGIFNDPLCRPGAWGRVSAGNYDATGTTSGTGGDVTARTKGNYRGVQVGSDFGCYRAFDGGWDLVFGATLGVNTGSSAQEIPLVAERTQSDFKQLYGGLYMTAINGAFTSDLQFRVDRTEYDVSNTSLGIADSFDTNGTTFSGAFSYSIPLEDTGFTLVPTAGFSYSRIASDDIEVPGGRLVTPDYDSRVGFLGGSAVYTMLGEDGLSVTNSFVTVTAYKDFADRPSSQYFDNPVSGGTLLDTLESDNLGTYGEVSLGLNYTRLLDHADSPFGARQLSASIRADHRFGDRIDSWGITAQARLQF